MLEEYLDVNEGIYIPSSKRHQPSMALRSWKAGHIFANGLLIVLRVVQVREFLMDWLLIVLPRS